MNSPIPTSRVADSPAAESEITESETTRHRRVRHAWAEAPHAHDEIARMVGRVLVIVLVGIIAYIFVRLLA